MEQAAVTVSVPSTGIAMTTRVLLVQAHPDYLILISPADSERRPLACGRLTYRWIDGPAATACGRRLLVAGQWKADCWDIEIFRSPCLLGVSCFPLVSITPPPPFHTSLTSIATSLDARRRATSSPSSKIRRGRLGYKFWARENERSTLPENGTG